MRQRLSVLFFTAVAIMGRLFHRLTVSALPLLFLIGGASRAEASCGQPQGGTTIINDTFNSGISGWVKGPGGTAGWSPLDAGGSTTSGSIAIVNNAQFGGAEVYVSQCLAISGGSSYNLSANIHPDNACCVAGQGAFPASPRATLHTGAMYVLLNFFSKPNCGSAPLSSFVRLDASAKTQSDDKWQFLTTSFTAPSNAVSVSITLDIFKDQAGDTLEGHFDDIVLASTGGFSPPDPNVLCLGDRFQARARWTTRDGQTGNGAPVALSADTGYFYFFSPDNVELIVKVLNGCGLNSSFWVFAGGLTDVGVVLTVTDSVTGSVQTYTNPMGTAFVPIQDTKAFVACGTVGTGEETFSSPPIGNADAAPPTGRERDFAGGAAWSLATLEAGCVPSPTTLCLNNQRFSVTTQWTRPDGTTGQGQAVALTRDTGLFWFFNSSNIEMVIKVLNGCGVDSAYWVFSGGLTNVKVVMTVTDTQTGAVKTYTNPQGQSFLPIQDTLAFACP